MHGTVAPLAVADVLGGPVSPLLVVVGVGLVALAVGYAALTRRRSSPSRVPQQRRPEVAGDDLVGGEAVGQAAAVEVWADEGAPKVLVVNRSSRPVHDVRAFVAFGRRRADCVGWIRTLPPTGEEAARVALTADGRESWIKWRNKDRNHGRDVAVECTFCDDAGQYWRRTTDGELEPLDSAEAAVQVTGR